RRSLPRRGAVPVGGRPPAAWQDPRRLTLPHVGSQYVRADRGDDRGEAGRSACCSWTGRDIRMVGADVGPWGPMGPGRGGNGLGQCWPRWGQEGWWGCCCCQGRRARRDRLLEAVFRVFHRGAFHSSYQNRPNSTVLTGPTGTLAGAPLLGCSLGWQIYGVQEVPGIRAGWGT